MNTVLQIHSSLHSDQGESSRLSDLYVSRWLDTHRDGAVIRRDLAREPLPHLTAEVFAAWRTPAAERTLAQRLQTALSDTLIGELRKADTLVLAVPMYNFGIPSTLRAWFDHIARSGETFRYGANGPEGLLTGKRALVFTTRGGQYANSPGDTIVPYLKQILGFVGIREVEIVYAEGLGMGAVREASLAAAHAQIETLDVQRLAA